MGKRTSGQRNGFSTPNIKSRELFEKRKILDRIEGNNAKRISRSTPNNVPFLKYEKPSRFQQILKGFALSIIFVALIGSVFIIFQLFTFNQSIESLRAEQIELAKKKNKERSCLIDYNITNGEYHLEKYNLNSAKEQFERALALEPRNKQALTGLTQTLLAHCLYQNLFCEESEAYLAFMNEQFPNVAFDLYENAVVEERIITN